MVTKLIRSLILFTIFVAVLSNPSCPKLKPGMTNVHLVCHTHDDVGWLKTVDQYYYGSKKYITPVGVQYILSSVVGSLLRDQSRKFIYVESAFFFRWWNEQNYKVKSDVKNLVKNGQLEFISGGWSMNDEAAAHYNAIIDQMTFGLAKINETFGPEAFPRIAWQIDPFGHSKEQASLFAQMGMDGLFIGRLDFEDKDKRWNSKQMEMVWKASNSLSDTSWLFTGALPNQYSPPKGFCFDLLCNIDPIIDDPTLEDNNTNEMVNNFLLSVEEQMDGYATSNLIMTMGDDFNYVNAEAWFTNLDKLIKHVNARQQNGSKVNVFYSTPSCYLDALHDADKKWPTKTDDFFPYASGEHSYWTGYFTSRPSLKGYIRKCNNLLQAVKQMAALTGMERGPHIDKLAAAMGVAQHHDAVTGTAKQDVTNDYAKRLSDGVDAAEEVLNEGFRIMTQSRNSIPRLTKYEYCPLLNISACPITELSDSFMVNVYNPVSRPVSHYIRIPVEKAEQYRVIDIQGRKLNVNLVPLPEAVLKIPGRTSIAKMELVFYAENIPGLGTKQFFVSSNGNYLPLEKTMYSTLNVDEDTVLTKGNISVILDSKSRRLKSIEVLDSNGTIKKINVTQDWNYYNAMGGGNDVEDDRASGAYVFRNSGPINNFTDPVQITAIFDGSLVGEIHQTWPSWITQILRIYKEKNHVEMEWVVGPINVGVEIVNRVEFGDMSTNHTFYTDANGREMQKRIKDFRPTFNLTDTEPVSRNYYPVTSRIIISSVKSEEQAALMNDRAQGGTSLSDGQMELMVHRRLMYDDGFGVGEALNEQQFGESLVARGRHIILHSAFASAECDFGCLHRQLGEELLLQPVLTFSNTTSYFGKPLFSKKSALRTPLPSNIRILTLEPWRKGEWLLRLENYFEKGESKLSGTSSVDVKNIFSDWSITNIDEVVLGANQLSSKVQRLKWKTQDDDVTNNRNDVVMKYRKRNRKFNCNEDRKKVDPNIFTFSPMQIRSFIVKVEAK